MPMNCIIISTLTRLSPTLIRSCTILVKRDKFKKCRTTLTCFYLHLSTEFTMSLSSVKSNQTCEYISVVRGVQREIKKKNLKEVKSDHRSSVPRKHNIFLEYRYIIRFACGFSSCLQLQFHAHVNQRLPLDTKCASLSLSLELWRKFVFFSSAG